MRKPLDIEIIRAEHDDARQTDDTMGGIQAMQRWAYGRGKELMTAVERLEGENAELDQSYADLSARFKVLNTQHTETLAELSSKTLQLAEAREALRWASQHYHPNTDSTICRRLPDGTIQGWDQHPAVRAAG